MNIRFNTIEKEAFKHYDPTFNSNEKLKLITFRYLLPFRIPFTNGNTTVIVTEGKKVLFQFLQTSEKDPTNKRVFIYKPLKRTII
ncbi:hypothetical protein PZM40_12300, partial [Staphylococcus epidermidis]|nr:hypothetical protein [Staphylococcus epidermidis]